jgi:hypothetical protein
MSHRFTRMLVLAAAAVVAVITTSPNIALAAGATASPSAERHCIAQPSPSGDPAMQCFTTFAAANDAVSAEGVGPDTTVIIGIDYTGTSFTGSSLTWYQSAGCGTYSASSMPTGWNDVVSSVANYNGCGSTLYQNTNFGGSTYSVGVNATKSTLGTFNDTASSQKWCTLSNC